MGEAARRKRERRKRYQQELEEDAARTKRQQTAAAKYGAPLVTQVGKVLAGMAAGMGAGLSMGTPVGTRTGRLCSHVPNIANGPRPKPTIKTGRSMGKSQAFARAYGRQTPRSDQTWWMLDTSFGLTPSMQRPPVRYLHEIVPRTMSVDFCNGEESKEYEEVLPPETAIFIKEQPGYELACMECPSSLTCLRGQDHWPSVCDHCRVAAARTVTAFDVVLHEKLNLKEIEAAVDYRCEDVRVSTMCPLFHNSQMTCYRCQNLREKREAKVIRVFAVGGYRPQSHAMLGKPRVVKKKLAKKRLKKLYWEQLWKAPGIAHYRRRKNLRPSKLKAYRMLEKKQKEHLFNDVISHSARTHKERKLKNRKRRKR
jgi:hypothetical protein